MLLSSQLHARNTISWFKTSCQNNGKESTSVKCISSKEKNLTPDNNIMNHPSVHGFSSVKLFGNEN
jgi:hypothetical protein